MAKVNFRQRKILVLILFMLEESVSLDFLAQTFQVSARTIRRDIENMEMNLEIGIDINHLINIQNNYMSILQAINNSNADLAKIEKAIISQIKMHVHNKTLTIKTIQSIMQKIGNFYLQFKSINHNEFSDKLICMHPLVVKHLAIIFDFSKKISDDFNLKKKIKNFSNPIDVLLFKIQLCLKDIQASELNDLNAFHIQELYHHVNLVFKKWIKISISQNNLYLEDLYRHLLFTKRISFNANIDHNFLSKENNEQILTLVLSTYNNTNEFKFDTLSLVYFKLMAIEEIQKINWHIITACYGGQGTSVMLKTIIKKYFTNSQITIMPIQQIEKNIQKQQFHLLILIDKNAYLNIQIKNAMFINPVEILHNNYLILKKINNALIDMLSQP